MRCASSLDSSTLSRSMIFFTRSCSSCIERSDAAIGSGIQRSMAARKNAGTNRGVKQAPFVVLIGANMPSILAEICFISNPQEEKLVKTAENRQAIAHSLFEGVRSYAESLSGTKSAVAAKTQKRQE